MLCDLVFYRSSIIFFTDRTWLVLLSDLIGIHKNSNKEVNVDMIKYHDTFFKVY